MSRFAAIDHTTRDFEKVLGSNVMVFAVTLLASALFITTFATGARPTLAFFTKGREPAGPLLILTFLVPFEPTELLIMNLFASFARTWATVWGDTSSRRKFA
jgi:O-antigen/teichoic acid export membrane protein